MHTLVRGLSAAAVLFGLAPASAVAIDWVTVGNPGNAADATGFGAVAYGYQLAMTEVTNAQYAAFLNAVAKADPGGLYNTAMGGGSTFPLPPPPPNYGGIRRSSSSGSYTYSPIAGRENLPVNYVSFWDALRFANWLHNGQPTGAQGAATTEDGAYTITAAGVSDNSITRKTGAAYALTSEDEWYKAAYYDATSGRYFAYPAGSSAPTACSPPPGGANHANCNQQANDATAVGSYAASKSPYGTFDQGGNVAEWNESIVTDTDRGFRGGWLGGGPSGLSSNPHYGIDPETEDGGVGFRVVSLPEPGADVLLIAGALCVLGLGRRPKR